MTQFDLAVMWLWYWVRVPYWQWKNAYQVSTIAENPWKHGGRRGKNRPDVVKFRIPSHRTDYRALIIDGWRDCNPGPMARLRRWMAA